MADFWSSCYVSDKPEKNIENALLIELIDFHLSSNKLIRVSSRNSIEIANFRSSSSTHAATVKHTRTLHTADIASYNILLGCEDSNIPRTFQIIYNGLLNMQTQFGPQASSKHMPLVIIT